MTAALISLAVLTRSDAVLFAVFLGIPIVLFSVRTWRQRIGIATVLLATGAIFILPWVIRNDVQMGGPDLSTNEGLTLAGLLYQVDIFPQ